MTGPRRPRRGRWSRPRVPGEQVDPVPVAEAVAEVAGDLGMGDVRSLGVLTAKWPELVGEGVAAHAQPRSLRHGVLTIAVDSGGWATELRFQAGELSARAAALVGDDAVREVRVLVDPRPISGSP